MLHERFIFGWLKNIFDIKHCINNLIICVFIVFVTLSLRLLLTIICFRKFYYFSMSLELHFASPPTGRARLRPSPVKRSAQAAFRRGSAGVLQR